MYALYTYKFLMRSQSTCISQVVKNGQDVIIQKGNGVCVFVCLILIYNSCSSPGVLLALAIYP